MYNNYFQDGGEDPTGADFFNSLLDANIQQDQESTQDNQSATDEQEMPNEFIQGLNDYAKETENSDLQTQLDELRQQIELNKTERNIDEQQSSLEEQLALADFYQTPQGEDALMSKYEPQPAQKNSQPEQPKYVAQDYIAQKESGGNYKALPYKKDGSLASSATGKYQFIWSVHHNDINKVTGIKTKEEFLNSPSAQEKYYAYWDKTTLTPQALAIQQTLAKQGKPIPPLDEIKAKVHFSPKGAKEFYYTGKSSVKDAFNTTPGSYAIGGYAVVFQGGRMVTTTNKEKRKYSI